MIINNICNILLQYTEIHFTRPNVTLQGRPKNTNTMYCGGEAPSQGNGWSTYASENLEYLSTCLSQAPEKQYRGTATLCE